MNLLPCPRILKLCPGTFTLPKRAIIHFDPNDATLLPIVKRLQTDVKEIGVELILGSARASRAVSSALAGHIIVRRTKNLPTDEASVGTREGARAPRSEGYALTIDKNGIQILFREIGGLHAAVATLRQLLQQYGRH